MTEREPRRLDVPVEPLAERDWERLERRLVAARDEELLAAPVVDLRRGARRLALVTMLVAGVAAGMGVMWWKASREPAPGPTAVAAAPGVTSAPEAPLPTRVVTPPGATSRLSLGDAVVEVGGDAELTVETAPGGAITILLARGSVDCDVEPRPGRAPFHVRADDVTVTVVGTRFVVEKRATVRVQVTRGKVHVASPAGDLQVAAGQEWDARHGLVTAGPADAGPRERVPDASPLVDPSTTPGDALAAAAAIESSDPDAAAARYRQLAASPDPVAAELAAYRLADLELTRSRWDASLAASRAYEQAFPHGAHLEDVLWFRVQAACGAYRSRAADTFARAYLARFPKGRHASAALSAAVCIH